MGRRERRTERPKILPTEATRVEVRAKRWWSPGSLLDSTGKAAGILTRAEKISVRRRLTIVATALVVFAALLASVGNYIFLARTPEKAAENYMNALQSGNYFSAVDRTAYGDRSAIFLKNSMYRAASGRVSSYEILSVDEKEDTATAKVLVSVENNSWIIELPLKKTHRTGLFNDTWQLDYPPQINENLTTPIALDSISVNGKKLKLKESNARHSETGYSWNIPLLPGQYDFSLPNDSYYTLVGGSQRVKVGILQGEIDPLTFTVRPSERMWSETNSAVESWLKRCESSNSLAPANCPVSAVYDSSGRPLADSGQTAQAGESVVSSASASSSRQASISDVEWELVSRPVLWLRESSDSPTKWQASRYAPAVFRLTYRANGQQKAETIEAYISAEVVSSGSSAAITVGLGEEASGK